MDDIILCEIYSNGDYIGIKTNEKNIKHTILNTTLTYDGSKLKHYFDGEIINELSYSGVILYPTKNSVMSIGSNPIRRNIRRTVCRYKCIFSKDIQ